MTKNKELSSSGDDEPKEKRRRPQLTRVGENDLPGFRLTTRAIAMVEATYDYRALTPPLYELLFFPHSNAQRIAKTDSNCLRYLRELYHREFLLRTEQAQTLSEGRKPLVYWLDKQGAALVAMQRGLALSELDWQPGGYKVGPMHLDHLLDTNRVRIAFVLSARQHDWTVNEWRDDLTLKRDHTTDVIIRKTEPGKKHRVEPDGYGLLTRPVSDEEDAVLRFFIEVDRQTVIGESPSGHRDLATKIELYREFFRPGGLYEARYGTTAGRVLFITTGEKRMANMKRITEAHGGKSRYWFTTLALATTRDILTAPIWGIASRNGLSALVEPMA
jgi:hypothetical protein